MRSFLYVAIRQNKNLFHENYVKKSKFKLSKLEKTTWSVHISSIKASIEDKDALKKCSNIIFF